MRGPQRGSKAITFTKRSSPGRWHWALFDYLRKSRSRGFVVSLSGGADSSAVSCFVHYALELGVHELGIEGVLDRLDYCDLKGATDTLRASQEVTRLHVPTQRQQLGHHQQRRAQPSRRL